MMSEADFVQGSAEWFAARAGCLGASQLADALAKTKTGWGASRANLIAQLVVERLTGLPTETFANAAMQRGTQMEPDARSAYEFDCNVDVREIGLIRHPTIGRTHASPDGLVGSDGLVEIKAPNSATHIETLLTGTIAQKYVLQMQWQMICCDRQWCDFVSYDDRLPVDMQLFVKRVARPDQSAVADLEKQVSEFLAEVDAKEKALRARFGQPEARAA